MLVRSFAPFASAGTREGEIQGGQPETGGRCRSVTLRRHVVTERVKGIDDPVIVQRLGQPPAQPSHGGEESRKAKGYPVVYWPALWGGRP